MTAAIAACCKDMDGSNGLGVLNRIINHTEGDLHDRLMDDLYAFLDYNLEFRRKYQNHTVMAGAGVSF